MQLISNYQAIRGLSLPDKSQKLVGKLQANFKTLGLLPIMVTDLQNTKGQMDFYMTLAGTIGKPILQGKLILSNESTEVTHLGIHLEKINLTLSSDKNNELQLEGSLFSNNGKLNISGKASPFLEGFPASIHLTGNDLQVLKAYGYTIYATPDLSLAHNNDLISLTGNLLIPSARIRAHSFVDDYVELPNDLSFINAIGEPANELCGSNLPYNYATDIKVTLGNDVKIDAFGIEGVLAGELIINKNPGANPTGVGRLSVSDGTYKAYGQKLKINQGQLIYAANPLTNPGLNIRASKKVAVTYQISNATSGNSNTGSTAISQAMEMLVGVTVQGTVQNPVISLFSEPATLSQTDILSYLAFGSSASNISGNAAGAGRVLFNAISASIDDPNKESFSETIQKSLGLDELGLASGSPLDPVINPFTQNTYLVVGKTFSSRFSMTYSLGLVEPVSFVRTRFKLTPGIALQAETSTDSIFGTDLLYSFSIP